MAVMLCNCYESVAILPDKMSYTAEDISRVGDELKADMAKLEDKSQILKDERLKNLLSSIKDQPASERAGFGQAVNELRVQLQQLVQTSEDEAVSAQLSPVDVTAPVDLNVVVEDFSPLFGPEVGGIHPVSRELDRIKDIFLRMGFSVEQSRLLDDDYHMFSSLNFPADHPARDEYDTFMTEEGFILPAHTSTMQNRVLKNSTPPIAAVIPGRTFRNEDVDATHEHTFHQVEGVFVDKGVALSDMLGTIQMFLESYFEEKIEFKTQPFYFPFVEPGLEYLIKMPQSLKKPGQNQDEWLEIMGCGMIHPNVLREGGVDPEQYSGFAWGMGVERLVMLKYGIEDVRHFMSGRLDFLELFGGKS